MRVLFAGLEDVVKTAIAGLLQQHVDVADAETDDLLP
jgi:hypothetical protein